MKAVILREPRLFATEDIDPPAAPGVGQALVRPHRVGVCGTDTSGYLGKMPFFAYPRIIGHELGVEVMALGPDVHHLTPGDRCAVEPYLHCGECRPCHRGRTNCCEHLEVLGVHTDGGLREAFLVPAAKLHPSAHLAYDQLALVETLAIGCHAVNRARPTPADEILIVGAGPIGLAVTQFAMLTGAAVTLLDINAERLEFARRTMSVKTTIQGPLPPQDVYAATAQGGFSIVFDATGNRASMNQAFHYTAYAGTLVYVGIHKDSIEVDDPLFHRHEMTLLASRNALPTDFVQIIRQIEAGLIDTNPWITHRIPWLDLPHRFPEITDPINRVVKAMIELDH